MPSHVTDSRGLSIHIQGVQPPPLPPRSPRPLRVPHWYSAIKPKHCLLQFSPLNECVCVCVCVPGPLRQGVSSESLQHPARYWYCESAAMPLKTKVVSHPTVTGPEWMGLFQPAAPPPPPPPPRRILGRQDKHVSPIGGSRVASSMEANEAVIEACYQTSI